MHAPQALLDFHERAHRSLRALMTHCRTLTPEELNRELAGFGYPSIRLQLHHEIGAERYWVGVLHGEIRAEEDDADFPTIDALETFRERTAAVTQEYLRKVSAEELNAPRPMRTWSGSTPTLRPAHVVLRTATHLYHHQGQIAAMCRILGKPVPAGLDFPLQPPEPVP
jgi:uncharacterized damage-inducible protein DinB